MAEELRRRRRQLRYQERDEHLYGFALLFARDQRLVGKQAGAIAFNPGTFNFSQYGARIGGPILRDKLFFFASCENDGLDQPGTTFRANKGSGRAPAACS